MLTLTFDDEQRDALALCLAHPYPSGQADGRFVVESGVRSQLVLVDVPTGLAPDLLVTHIADDVRQGLVHGLRGIHDESSEDGAVRVVFTPTAGTEPDRVEAELRTSFIRVRARSERALTRLADLVERQGSRVTLEVDDWVTVHLILIDARRRRPSDQAVVSTARLLDRRMGPSWGFALRSRVARAARLRPVRAWLRRR